jgi:hypothetical protein
VCLIDEGDPGVSGHAARGVVVRAMRPPPEGLSREVYALVGTPFDVVEHSALGERRFTTLLVGYDGSIDETVLTT